MKADFIFNLGIDGKQMTGALDMIKRHFVSLLSVTAIEEFTRRTLEWAEETDNLAERWGVTAEEVQALQFAAKKSGTEVETLGKSLRFLKLAISEALMPGTEGDKKRSILAWYGLTDDDLKNADKNILAVFTKLGNAIKSKGAIVPQYAMLKDIFGRNFDELVPMFEKGVDKLIDQFNKLGLVVDNGLVKELKMAGRETDILIGKLDRAGKRVLGMFATLVNHPNVAMAFAKDMFLPMRAWNALHGKDMPATTKALTDLYSSDEYNEKRNPESTNPLPDITPNRQTSVKRVSARDTADSLARIGGYIGAQQDRTRARFYSTVEARLRAIEYATRNLDRKMTTEDYAH